MSSPEFMPESRQIVRCGGVAAAAASLMTFGRPRIGPPPARMALLSLKLQRSTPEHRLETRPCLLPYTSKYCKQAARRRVAQVSSHMLQVCALRNSLARTTPSPFQIDLICADRTGDCHPQQPSAWICLTWHCLSPPPATLRPSNAGTVLWTLSRNFVGGHGRRPVQRPASPQLVRHSSIPVN